MGHLLKKFKKYIFHSNLPAAVAERLGEKCKACSFSLSVHMKRYARNEAQDPKKFQSPEATAEENAAARSKAKKEKGGALYKKQQKLRTLHILSRWKMLGVPLEGVPVSLRLQIEEECPEEVQLEVLQPCKVI